MSVKCIHALVLYFDPMLFSQTMARQRNLNFFIDKMQKSKELYALKGSYMCISSQKWLMKLPRQLNPLLKAITGVNLSSHTPSY